MPFNGSGGFTRVRDWTNDAAAKIKIRADMHDSEDDNFAAGLSQVICKDGQTQPTANLPMNNFRHSGASDPVNPQDYATKHYADLIRTFTTGITLTGASTGSTPNFVSTAYIGFTEADMSIVARKADAAPTVPVLNRLAWNTQADGKGTDLAYIDEAGKLVMLGTSGVYSQTDAKYPVGTITERMITATETWDVAANAKGIKYAEFEAQACGGNGGSSASTGAATVATGGAGGAGGYGRRLFTKAELGTSVVITINNSPAGTTSIVCNGTGAITASVTGGASGATGAAAANCGGAAGAGGTSSNFTINGTGMYGGASWGGAYFNTASLQVRGPGGSSAFGSGALANTTGGTSAGAGASGWGAGGGGGGCGFSGASQVGGSGTNAFIKLREYY